MANIKKIKHMIIMNLTNKTYDYYELNKDGKKNFIINSKYYIKDINKETGNFITVDKKNNTI